MTIKSFFRAKMPFLFFGLFLFFGNLNSAEDLTLTRAMPQSTTVQTQMGPNVENPLLVQRPVGGGQSIVKTFSSSARSEIEDFLDFLKKVEGVPAGLDFPVAQDDEATFKTKSTALLGELDRLMSDQKNLREGWVNQIRKHLKVKTGFSDWFNSINSRIERLETSVVAIQKILGSEKIGRALDQATRSVAAVRPAIASEATRQMR